MKFQKMDPKQVPQVIALGVLSLGALGYAAVNFMGSPAKSNSPVQAGQPAAVQSASATAENGNTPGNAPGNGPETTMAQGNVPGGFSLPGQYNPDPFRGPAEEKPKPAAPPAPRITAPPRSNPNPLPPAGGGYNPPAAAPATQVLPVTPVEPPAPERPNVVVTGIIDVEGNPDMALIEFGSESRIIQIGDLLSDYKVKKIGLDGIWLVHGKDRFFVALGPQAAPGAPATGAQPGRS